MNGSEPVLRLHRLCLTWLAVSLPPTIWAGLTLVAMVPLNAVAANERANGAEKGVAKHAQRGAEVSRWPALQAAPRLEATDLDGKLWRIQELRGRAVLLYFGASACEPCRVDVLGLHKLAEIHDSEKLVILVINVKESSDMAEQYAKDAALTLPVLPDTTGAMAKAWGATSFPATVLVAADGKPRQRIRGKVDWSSPQVAKLIESLFRREKLGPRSPNP